MGLRKILKLATQVCCQLPVVFVMYFIKLAVISNIAHKSFHLKGTENTFVGHHSSVSCLKNISRRQLEFVLGMS